MRRSAVIACFAATLSGCGGAPEIAGVHEARSRAALGSEAVGP